jgi:hypothetical protein
MTITFEMLEEKFGAEAPKVFAKIALIGGFGKVPATHQGGLDVSGITGDAKKQIDDLLGVGKNKSNKMEIE